MLELVHKFIVFSEGLGPIGFWVVMSLITLSFTWLAYRVLGLGGALGILLVIFFTYVLYSNDSFNKYKENQRNENLHMKQLEDELNYDNRSSLENEPDLEGELDNDS